MSRMKYVFVLIQGIYSLFFGWTVGRWSLADVALQHLLDNWGLKVEKMNRSKHPIIISRANKVIGIAGKDIKCVLKKSCKKDNCCPPQISSAFYYLYCIVLQYLNEGSILLGVTSETLSAPVGLQSWCLVGLNWHKKQTNDEGWFGRWGRKKIEKILTEAFSHISSIVLLVLLVGIGNRSL